METKQCTRCNETKPLTDFWRKSAGKKGLQSQCKTCSALAIAHSRLRPSRHYVEPGQKRCTSCKTVKAVEDFSRNRQCADGRHYRCKRCCNDNNRSYRQNADNVAKITAQRRIRNTPRENRNKIYDQKLRKRYGLPKEWTYAAMLAAQGGSCAICERPDNPGMFRFAVDHNEITGVVRGLLCTCCNQALGQMRDSPALLRKAAAYLETPPAQALASIS